MALQIPEDMSAEEDRTVEDRKDMLEVEDNFVVEVDKRVAVDIVDHIEVDRVAGEDMTAVEGNFRMDLDNSLVMSGIYLEFAYLSS